jgi:hypothetical protein
MAMRKYGLFHKVGKRWIRLYPRLAFGKATAIRVFQNRLLDLTFRGKTPALRPIKESEKESDRERESGLIGGKYNRGVAAFGWAE